MQLIERYEEVLSRVKDPAAAATLVLASALTASDVLTVEETANALRTTPRTVFRLIETGRLKSFRIGKRGLRVARAAILEYIDGGRA